MAFYRSVKRLIYDYIINRLNSDIESEKEIETLLINERAILYIFENTEPVFYFNGGIDLDITVADILNSYQKEIDSKYDIVSGMDSFNRNIVVISNNKDNKVSEKGVFSNLKSFYVILITLICLLLLIAIYYGVKIGKVILHVMSWIN
ncbi:hypothetical protein ACFFH4_05125 [Halalkalibacter alkalisediminis]|uniref:Uncharacterized protein n=1 Tax=Halalkalibacter alkalisediminis TaxID=935616 RepID=A0ABV6NCQ4_9BACI